MIENLKAEIFKALAHQARIQILEFLKDGEKCVCEIIEHLEMEQSNVSQHLSVLKRQDLVSSRKDGARVIYFLKHPEVIDLLDQAGVVLEKQLLENQRALQSLGKAASRERGQG